MTIPVELKNLLDHGDYTLIKEMYDERHAQGKDADYKTVTVEYVRMVVQGERITKREGTAAEEILRIATYYLENKRDFRETVLAL